MASPSQRPKGRDGVISTLDLVIQGLTLAKDTCGFPPAQAALGAAGVLLTMIRVRSLPPWCAPGSRLFRTAWPTNRITSILGWHAPMCAKPSKWVWTGDDWTSSAHPWSGRLRNLPSRSNCQCVSQVARSPGSNRRTVEEIQKQIVDRGKRHLASRVLYAKSDKDKIMAWGQDLNRIVQNFNVRLVDSRRCSLTASFQTGLTVNNNVLLTDLHRNVFAGQEGAVGRHQLVSVAHQSLEGKC